MALKTTADAIDQAWFDAQPSSHRAHLGASSIGRECRRELWYSFRWNTKIQHSGRLLRLFDRGQNEEARFTADLEKIGAKVWEVDPETGHQFNWSEFGGHFSGSCDGFATGLPEAPHDLHLLEMKTHGDKSFKLLEKKQVKGSKPEHAVQMNIYMHWARRAGMEVSDSLYMAVNKNTDALYLERGKYDESAALEIVKKAGDIIASTEPPARIREDATHYYCRSFCDHRESCNGDKPADANCRTCISATPNMENGTWRCEHYDIDLGTETQRVGGKCPAHLFIPALVPFADAIDAGESPRFVRYKIKGTDFEFINGATDSTAPAYKSRELQHLTPDLITDPNLQAITDRFAGEIISTKKDVKREQEKDNQTPTPPQHSRRVPAARNI